ncbi:nucleotidyltransferase family protein [Tractidigestivibacter montrealensis]|uniref:Nucleotidyltransferase domain-containing protein n=1 Tax=Tractidigestivibacter montrealensis TaxID=2972466 RepID=A0ABT1Z5C9_9ACTN|nr:nucleotidyltransferase domain-containing protein [Tractidigestivibacter montrealensis]
MAGRCRDPWRTRGIDQLPGWLVEGIREGACSCAGVRDVLVFGSYARGEARAGSDIDICVLYDGAPGDSRVVSGNVRAAVHPFLGRARMECDVVAFPLGDDGAGVWDQGFRDRVMREGVSLCSSR